MADQNEVKGEAKLEQDELDDLLRQASDGANEIAAAAAAQRLATNATIDASLALARRSRTMRQSNPAMQAMKPPPSDLTQRLEALKAK